MTTASTTNSANADTGSEVPGTIGPTAKSAYCCGKSVTASVAEHDVARARGRAASVPMVTASEGSPSRVTSSPLTRPHTAPSTSSSGMIVSIGQPGVPQRAHHRAGQAEHGGDRQVDLAGDDQQRHRQRDQRDPQRSPSRKDRLPRVAKLGEVTERRRRTRPAAGRRRARPSGAGPRPPGADAARPGRRCGPRRVSAMAGVPPSQSARRRAGRGPGRR